MKSWLANAGCVMKCSFVVDFLRTAGAVLCPHYDQIGPLWTVDNNNNKKKRSSKRSLWQYKNSAQAPPIKPHCTRSVCHRAPRNSSQGKPTLKWNKLPWKLTNVIGRCSYTNSPSWTVVHLPLHPQVVTLFFQQDLRVLPYLADFALYYLVDFRLGWGQNLLSVDSFLVDTDWNFPCGFATHLTNSVFSQESTRNTDLCSAHSLTA